MSPRRTKRRRPRRSRNRRAGPQRGAGPSWSRSETSNFTGLTAIERFPNGDVVAIGAAGEDISRASQIRLARYPPDGAEVSTWLWPEEPSDAAPSYATLAADTGTR